jgi:hypothetical protein
MKSSFRWLQKAKTELKRLRHPQNTSQEGTAVMLELAGFDVPGENSE